MARADRLQVTARHRDRGGPCFGSSHPRGHPIPLSRGTRSWPRSRASTSVATASRWGVAGADMDRRSARRDGQLRERHPVLLRLDRPRHRRTADASGSSATRRATRPMRPPSTVQRRCGATGHGKRQRPAVRLRDLARPRRTSRRHPLASRRRAVRIPRSMGSAALALAYVANGRFDAFVQQGGPVDLGRGRRGAHRRTLRRRRHRLPGGRLVRPRAQSQAARARRRTARPPRDAAGSRQGLTDRTEVTGPRPLAATVAGVDRPGGGVREPPTASAPRRLVGLPAALHLGRQPELVDEHRVPLGVGLLGRLVGACLWLEVAGGTLLAHRGLRSIADLIGPVSANASIGPARRRQAGCRVSDMTLAAQPGGSPTRGRSSDADGPAVVRGPTGRRTASRRRAACRASAARRVRAGGVERPFADVPAPGRARTSS